MDKYLLRALFVFLFIAICYGALILISRATRGRIIADSFSALNGVLYLLLIINSYVVLKEPFPFVINLALIVGALCVRRRMYGRWI